MPWAPQHRAQLRGIGHTRPHQASGLFSHTQHNGAALGVGHSGIGLPKTAGHATARRLEFGIDALGAGLQGGEEVELAHDDYERLNLCLRQQRTPEDQRLADPVGLIDDAQAVGVGVAVGDEDAEGERDHHKDSASESGGSGNCNCNCSLRRCCSV